MMTLLFILLFILNESIYFLHVTGTGRQGMRAEGWPRQKVYGKKLRTPYPSPTFLQIVYYVMYSLGIREQYIFGGKSAFGHKTPFAVWCKNYLEKSWAQYYPFHISFNLIFRLPWSINTIYCRVEDWESKWKCKQILLLNQNLRSMQERKNREAREGRKGEENKYLE